MLKILTQHQNDSTLQSIQGNHLAHKMDTAMNCLRLFLAGQPCLILHLNIFEKKKIDEKIDFFLIDLFLKKIPCGFLWANPVTVAITILPT